MAESKKESTNTNKSNQWLQTYDELILKQKEKESRDLGEENIIKPKEENRKLKISYYLGVFFKTILIAAILVFALIGTVAVFNPAPRQAIFELFSNTF